MNLICLFLLLISFAWAKPEMHEIHAGKKISIDVPHEWEAVKDYYGLPLTLLGPFANESRPAIMVMFTGMDEKNFPQKELEIILRDYKKEKEAWVSEHKGELVKYESVTGIKLRHTAGHYIGAEFVIKDIHFIERSYYLNCKEETYNFKYSIRDEHRKHLEEIGKILESFRCE